MSLSNLQSERSRDIAKRVLRAPLYLYQLGWGPVLTWVPLLILTSKGRTSGLPRHVVVEYRRHGKKYYTVSGWGADSNWYRNIEQEPLVTIQHGGKIFGARAQRVEDHAEALRALYMFSRNSWIYETLFARMASADAAGSEHAGGGGRRVYRRTPGADWRSTDLAAGRTFQPASAADGEFVCPCSRSAIAGCAFAVAEAESLGRAR